MRSAGCEAGAQGMVVLVKGYRRGAASCDLAEHPIQVHEVEKSRTESEPEKTEDKEKAQ
jgi:hypothetical protein